MRRQGFTLFLFAAVLALGAAALSGCAPAGEVANTSAPAPSPAASPGGGKIPVTTSSEEARKEFTQGRDMAERLLAQDSLQHFDKAISLDPNFALAELGRANASQSAKEFFDHLKKAVDLSARASEGERLLILATQAGAKGEAVKREMQLDHLGPRHPGAESAHLPGRGGPRR